MDQRRPIRVLIADDNKEFICSLRALLEGQRDVEVVAAAYSGPEAVSCAAALHPDVAVLDVRMPGFSGIEATRAIMSLGMHAAVLILSVSVDRPYVVAAVKAGAAGYLSKSASEHELISAVRTLARGGSCFLALSGCASASLYRNPRIAERDLQI